MIRKCLKFSGILGVMLLPASLWSAPMISVDSANFDVGIIHEGEFESVKHTFKIKNTGDKVLVIERVRPG